MDQYRLSFLSSMQAGDALTRLVWEVEEMHKYSDRLLPTALAYMAHSWINNAHGKDLAEVFVYLEENAQSKNLATVEQLLQTQSYYGPILEKTHIDRAATYLFNRKNGTDKDFGLKLYEKLQQSP
ncbi:MAG: hypothetical protein Q4E47_01475 [Candidatus Saccharibacteria bacterium]|nr:hypothetical protein [Candidatus Saccharibacteria bacterium]